MRLAAGSLLVVFATVACFDDPGPPSGDEVGDSGSSESSGTSESGTSESETGSGTSESETGSSETGSSETEATETGSEIVGVWEPCGPGMTCEGGGVCLTSSIGWYDFAICAPQGCALGGDCPQPPPGFGVASACDDDACVLVCNDNSECGPGMICKDGICLFNVPWGPCFLTDACPEGSKCVADKSVSACLPTCTGSDECPSIGPRFVSPTCVNGGCEIPCMANEQCPGGMDCAGDVCRYPGLIP